MILTMAATFASAQSSSPRKFRKPVKPVLQLPLPRGPLPQVPLDQLPAAPPQVSYVNDQLTIVAENSTLGDILREVRKQTGASIDIPGNPTDRVATRIGPGPARDVLATLLNGTSYNYVMVGSAANPAVLSSVVLTSRPGGGVAETAQNQPSSVYTPQEPINNFGPGTGRPGMMPPGFVPPGRLPGFQQPPQPVNTADAGDDSDSDNSDSDDDSADDNSDQDQQAGQGDQAGGQPGQPPNAGPRTPQQILQMMQRNQQQGQQPPQQPPQDQQ